MSRIIMLVPITPNTGLQTIALGMVQAIQQKSFKAVALHRLNISDVTSFLAQNRNDELLEKIIAINEGEAVKNDIVINLGFSLGETNPFAMELNFKLATALDAALIFVGSLENISHAQFIQNLQMIASPYLHIHEHEILGLAINKNRNLEKFPDFSQLIEKYSFFSAIKTGHLLADIQFLPSHAGQDISKEVSQYIHADWVKNFLAHEYERKMTPPLFFHQLMLRAQKAQKRIVLPEGDEPRTIRAANICAGRNLAQCILLGERKAIEQKVSEIGVTLHDKIIVIEPRPVRDKYAPALYELRKHKGLTLDEAKNQLEDNVVLATMMLQLGEVDGIVSGAVHTTANTIRPALQIIKTKPDTSNVSSIFFVCLPNQVLVYGDCAINENPTADGLADIAIQSADSAKTLGIAPRVAMLSYSTGTSGAGPDVEKVKQATELVRRKRLDILIEGPIQYDAAIAKDVAALKLPAGNKVAGKATVFIFPDLNAGNIVSKAVQRSANVVCAGPMLQGLRKPVNDLSRGCLVEDIVFTIALTAIQSE